MKKLDNCLQVYFAFLKYINTSAISMLKKVNSFIMFKLDFHNLTLTLFEFDKIITVHPPPHRQTILIRNVKDAGNFVNKFSIQN